MAQKVLQIPETAIKTHSRVSANGPTPRIDKNSFNLSTKGDNGRTGLHSAAFHSRGILDYHLGQTDAKNNNNANDLHRETPLHLIEDVRFLFHHGADRKVKANDGHSPHLPHGNPKR